MGVSIYTPDSTKILHTAYADFVSRQISRKVHVVQYDDGLPILAVKLFSDGQPYTIPSNADINIKLRKPDGKFVYNPALGCDSTRRIVYFEITYQMVVLSGEVSPIVEVVIGTSVSASSSIGIIIDRNPISSSMISSTSEWKTIKSSIEYAKESLDAAAKASASRSAAAISESNALSYRNAAQTAATNASNSASSSATSETNAAKSASNAKVSETNAKTSEINASNSASSASISETNAKISEDNAANSENIARVKAVESKDYSIASKSYAVGDAGYRAGENTDNAKFYSEQSKGSMYSAKTSEYNSDIYSLLAKSYAVGDSTAVLGDGDGNEIVTSDGFAIEIFSREGEDTDNAKFYSEQAAKYSKAAESYAIGDTDYRENESVDNAKYYYQLSKEISERLGGALLLSGVKGDAETEYRTGYVNITPENIGAYDKDSIDQMMDTLMATLGKTINSLTAKIEELEELSAYSYLVDSEGNKFVTSDGYKIILAN